MKTGREKPEGAENIKEIRFDEKSLETDLSWNGEDVGILEVKKVGAKTYEHVFQSEKTTAKSPLGLAGSKSTEDKKRRWLRNGFIKEIPEQPSGKDFADKIWNPLADEIKARDIISKFYELPTIHALETGEMIEELVIEESVDATSNYSVILRVNYDGESESFELDSNSILSMRKIKSAFLQHFNTIPTSIIEMDKKDWQQGVIAQLKERGKVTKADEGISTQKYLRDLVVDEVKRSDITKDREEVFDKRGKVELENGVLWLPSSRIKNILEEERSRVNLSKVLKWCRPFMAKINENPKGKRIGDSVRQFWGFSPTRCEINIDEFTERGDGE